MPSVRYRNVASGSVSTYATTIPRLERSDQWERLEGDQWDVPKVIPGFEDEPYPDVCDVCGFIAKNAAGLSAHVRSHDDG